MLMKIQKIQTLVKSKLTCTNTFEMIIEEGHLMRDSNIPGLRTFVERNHGLQKLSTRSKMSSQKINAMLDAKIELQNFTVNLCVCDVKTISLRLNQLYDRGFYQSLSIDTKAWYHFKQNINQISALENLRLNLFRREIDPSTSLDYSGTSTAFPIDLHSTAKSFVNLKRLYFHRIESWIIEPFIQYSAKLKAIKIRYLGGKLVDLSKLNKKQEHLFGARKVTVYLEESVFLATK